MKFKWILRVKNFEIPVIGIIIFLIVFIWSLGMILAPLTLPPDSVKDLSGITMKSDNEDMIEDMNPYARHYYESGDTNCHTKVERSFFVNGNQMPFCARDVGIFFGMAMGLFIVLFIRFELKLWWIIGGLVPMGVDWVLQSYLLLYNNNFTRLLTGGITGVVVTFALGYVIWDVSKSAEYRAVLKSQPPTPGYNPPELGSSIDSEVHENIKDEDPVDTNPPSDMQDQ
jgi:uncharacterized membrane protein